MDLPVVHHVTLTVTDPDRSAAFYQRLLGPAEVAERTGNGWRRLRLLMSIKTRKILRKISVI